MEDAAALAEGKRLLSELTPKVVIAVERAGMTPRGTYHNMLGQDYSEGRARTDYLVEEAAKRGIPTIGVGDGGNEIGMGAIQSRPQACAARRNSLREDGYRRSAPLRGVELGLLRDPSWIGAADRKS